MQPKDAILKSLIGDKDFSKHMTSHVKGSLSRMPAFEVNWVQTAYPFINHINLSWLTSNQIRLHHLCTSKNASLSLFAKKQLWTSLKSKDLLPFPIIASMPLGHLSQLNESQIKKLCHLLGLYDLAIDARKIVQTKTRLAIENSLSEEQKHFLQSHAATPSPIDFGRLDLSKWDKSKTSLQAVIFQRGLNRLAKALFDCDQSLLWYITRRLDKSLSAQLMKLKTDVKKTDAKKRLIQEVENGVKALL